MTPASKEEENSLESVGILSPIPQLDGEVGDDGKVIFQFTSDYGEEDINHTLSEIFPEGEVTMESRDRIKPLSACHRWTVVIASDNPKDFPWPKMKPWDVEVFQELKRIM